MPITTDGYGIKLMVRKEKLTEFPVFTSSEFPDYVELYYFGIRQDEWRTMWLRENNEIIDIENDYLKLNGTQVFYNKQVVDVDNDTFNINSYNTVIVRNKLVLISSKTSGMILPGFKCLNHDCAKRDCIVLWKDLIFCGICGMEHKLDSYGSPLKKIDVTQKSFEQAQVFVGV